LFSPVPNDSVCAWIVLFIYDLHLFVSLRRNKLWRPFALSVRGCSLSGIFTPPPDVTPLCPCLYLQLFVGLLHNGGWKAQPPFYSSFGTKNTALKVTVLVKWSIKMARVHHLFVAQCTVGRIVLGWKSQQPSTRKSGRPQKLFNREVRGASQAKQASFKA
jgi:hypothetical protein